MATNQSDLLTRVLDEAERKYQQNYLGVSDDNCAHFVRDCFRDAGYPLPETRMPSDMAICQANGYPLGRLYANSLAGDEIGRKLPIEKAEPGDILLFTNVGASSSSFAAGTITHVGICIGNNLMIDHGSSGMNKRDYRVWPGPLNYAEARRPRLFDVPKTRIELDHGKLELKHRNSKMVNLDVEVNLTTSGPIGFLKQKIGKVHIPGLRGGLDVAVNHVPVNHYKAIWLHVDDAASKDTYQLCYQHGKTSAAVNGQKVNDFRCEMTSKGGSLHVKVNGKEIRTRDAAIEIVHVG